MTWRRLKVDVAVLLPLVALPLYIHFWWIAHYHFVPTLDGAIHLGLGAAFRAILLSPMRGFEKLVCLWTWPGYWPQVVYLTSALGSTAWGVGSDAAVKSFAPFIVMLVVGAYVLGRQAGGWYTGAAAACLAAGDPVLLYTERRYWLEMPMVALIVDALAVLALCQKFSHRGWSCLLGITLGVAFLTKYTVIWYLAPPLLLVVWQSLRESGSSRSDLLRLAGIVGVALLTFLGLARWSVVHRSYVQVAANLAPPLSQALVLCTLLLCAAWWIASRRWLPDRLSNLSCCLCMCLLTIGPWVLANLYVLRLRMDQDVWHHAHNDLGRNLATCWSMLPLPTQLAALAGTLSVLFWKERRALFMPVLLSYLGGIIPTQLFLGPILRYWSPCGVLLTILGMACVPAQRRVCTAVLVGAVAWTAFHMPVERADTQRAVLFETSPNFPFPGTIQSVGLDYEDAAHEILQRVNSDTRTLYVSLPRRRRPDEQAQEDECGIRDLYALMLAANVWENRLLGIALVLPDGDGFRRTQDDFFAEARTCTLAAAYGLGKASYVTPPAPPDALIVPPGLQSTDWLRASHYQLSYQWNDRLLLFQRSGRSAGQ